jgi:hypothetical protein
MKSMYKEQPKSTLEGRNKSPEISKAREKTPEERFEKIKGLFLAESLNEVQSKLDDVRRTHPREIKREIDKKHRLLSPSKELVEPLPQVLVDMRRALNEVQVAQEKGDKEGERLAQEKLDNLYREGTDYFGEAERYHYNGLDNVKFSQERLESVPKFRKYAEKKYADLLTLIKTGSKGPTAEQILEEYRLSEHIAEDIQKLTPEQQAALEAEFRKIQKEHKELLDEVERAAGKNKIPEDEKEEFFADVEKKCAELTPTLIDTARKAIIKAGYKWSKDKQKVVVGE